MDLPGLAVTPVARDGEARFRALMDGHHYLGAPSKIGQTVWYAADDGSGEWPALAAFSAAALKCGARDAWIGWSRREQFGRLHLIANNVRLLLRGRRPNLGSRFLALCARRISADWRARYHHPLLLLETFVDPDRFHGTVYRAANWTPVGETGGYRRRRDGYVAGSTPKRVLLLPLDRNARSLLRAPGLATEHQLHGAERMRKLNVAEAAGILACLKGTVDDPREASGRRHRIESLLALCTAATLCGATGWQSIHEWIQSLSPAMLDRFRCRRIDGVHQRPSVYCIRNIMIKVDPGQLARATARFCREHGWDQGAGIAVDGKTVRGAGRQTHVPGASTHGASAPLPQKNRSDRRRRRGEGNQRDRRLHPDHGHGPGHRRTHRHRRRPSRPDRNLRLPACPGRPLHAPRQGQPEEPARGDQGPLRLAVPGTGGLRDPPVAAGARADRAARDPGLHGSGDRDLLPVGRAGLHDQADRPGIPPRAERKARDAWQAERRDRLRHHGPHAGDRRRRSPPCLQPRALVVRARPPDPRRCRDVERRQVPGRRRTRPGEPGCLRRLAIGLILGRGRPVAPTIGNLNRNPRLVPGWPRPVRNALARTKSAT